MSKEFDKLKEQAKQYDIKVKERRNQAYQYARSLGFPYQEARLLAGSSRERIDRLSKEL